MVRRVYNWFVFFLKQGDHSLKEHELLEQQKRVMPLIFNPMFQFVSCYF